MISLKEINVGQCDINYRHITFCKTNALFFKMPSLYYVTVWIKLDMNGMSVM